MNYASLALGFAFVALALTFFGRARKAADPGEAKKARTSGILFVVAGALFFIAFLLGLVND